MSLRHGLKTHCFCGTAAAGVHACVLLFLPPQHSFLPPSATLPTLQAPRYQSCTVVYSKVGVECFYPSICHMQRISKGGLLLPLSLSLSVQQKPPFSILFTLSCWDLSHRRLAGAGEFSLLPENQGSMNGSS